MWASCWNITRSSSFLNFTPPALVYSEYRHPFIFSYYVCGGLIFFFFLFFFPHRAGGGREVERKWICPAVNWGSFPSPPWLLKGQSWFPLLRETKTAREGGLMETAWNGQSLNILVRREKSKTKAPLITKVALWKIIQSNNLANIIKSHRWGCWWMDCNMQLAVLAVTYH